MRNAGLLNSSFLVIATILVAAPQLAKAQSFDATSTVMAGSAAVTTGLNTTTISTFTGNVVINWTPNAVGGSGPIIFQPAGTIAQFTNLDSSNFAILNRIIPTNPARPVVFNGTVLSELIDTTTGASLGRGGTLFFYSPGGILVGPTGVFDVGNLVLTTSDVPYNASSGEFGSAGTFNFLAANPGSTVEVQSGARITSGPFNAYVALIGPKVVNAGTITVDGSAVLVAADASTITFRPDGLFDIQIDEGTSVNGEVLTNTGTIIGAAATPSAAHRIYAVAIPKNNAITMAIRGGGTLGFDVAAAANVDGNAIVLSGGYDIIGGEIEAIRSTRGSAAPTTLAIDAIDATSQLTGKATGRALLQVQGGNAASFASNVNLSGVTDPAAASADGAIVVVEGVGSTLDIVGNVVVRSLDAGVINGGLASDSGGARISVRQGSLTVGGTAQVDASRTGVPTFASRAGEAALVASDGAVVDLGQDLILAADGIGQPVAAAIGSGPMPGFGGTARLSFSGGAAVTVAGDLAVSARGSGGAVPFGGFAGADGTGGVARIESLAGGGTFSVTGTTLVDASGLGSNGGGCVSCTIEGGTGTGGSAGILAAAGATLILSGAATIEASGRGGAALLNGGKGGGGGLGGNAFVSATGGAVIAEASLSVLADGTGGAGALNDNVASPPTGNGGSGGAGLGGNASLAAGNADALGGGGSITISGDTLVSGSGTGGGGGGGGVLGRGGQATVTARNGAVRGAALSTRALGLGGAGSNRGAGGTGVGGTALVMAYSALEGDAVVTFGTTAITARGTGGTGSAAALAGDPGRAGGTGTGGTASAVAEAGNAALTLGYTAINASGGGGAGGTGADGLSVAATDGGAGGNGRGGIATFGVLSGLDTGAVNTGSATFAGANVLANGIGGTAGAGGVGGIGGAAGAAGTAQGGAAILVAQGGAVTLSGAAQIQANATGGVGRGLGTGGNATVGGTVGGDGNIQPLGAQLSVSSRTGQADQRGQLTATSLAFSARALGGTGALLGTSTNLGNPLAFRVNGGTINADSLGFVAVGATAPGQAPSVMSLAGGDTTLTGAFSFETPGTLTAALGGAELFSQSTLISASNWLSGAVPAGASGVIHGTNSVSLITGADLFGNFSADTQGSLTLSAGGLIRLDNLTAVGAIAVDAGTTIALGNLGAGSTVLVAAPGNVTVGDVVAVGDATLTSGAALVAGSVTTGQSARLRGAASLALTGNVVAGAAIRLSSGGTVTGRDLSAGLVNASSVSGSSYDIAAVGLGGIDLGEVAAAHEIRLFTPLAVTAGALSGREIGVLAGGTMALGSIAATNRVLLADYAMAPIGGDPLGLYDTDALFAAVPVAAGGAITVAGATTSGALTAQSDLGISLEAITTTQTLLANGAVNLQAGGALATGAILADDRIEAGAGGTLDLVSASAGDALVLNGTGAITTGNLFGGNGVGVTGLGAVTTGALGSGAGSTISITSGGAMDIASVTSGDFAVLNASGVLTSGSILAQGDVQVTGSDSVTLGAITGLAGRAQIQAGNALLTGAITMSDGIALTSTTGNVTTGNLITGTGPFAIGDIAITAGGAVSVGTMFARTGLAITAGTDMVLGAGSTDNGDIVLGAGGAITASDLVTGTGRLQATAGESAVLGNLVANGLNGGVGLEISANGALGLGSAAVNLGDIRLTSSGALSAGALSADGGLLQVTSGGNLTLTGPARASGNAQFDVTGTMAAGAISAAGRIGLTATGAVGTGDLAATGALVVEGTALTLGNLAGGSVAVDAGATLSAGTVTALAGDAVLGATGNLTARAITATGAVTAASLGTLDLASVASGDIAVPGEVVTLSAGGAMTVGAITSFGNLVVAGGDSVTLGEVRVESGGSATLSAANTLATRSVAASRIAMTSTSGDITADSLGAGTLDINAGGAVLVGTLNAFGGTSIAAGTGVSLGSVNSDLGDVVVTAGGDITSGNLSVTDGGLSMTAGGSAVLGSVFFSGLTSGAGLDIAAGGALQMGAASPITGELRLTSGGALAAGALTATSGPILVTAGGDTELSGLVSSGTSDVVIGVTGALVLRGAAVAAGRIGLTATGAITTDALTATGALAVGGTALALGNLAGSTVAIDAATTLGAGTVEAAGGAVSLTAAGDLVSELVRASGAVTLTSTGGAAAAGDLTSTGGAVSLTASSAGSAGVVTAASGIAMRAGGTLGLTAATSARGDVVLDAATDLASGDLVAAGGRLLLSSGGAAILGNLSAAGLGGSARLQVTAGTALTLGNADAGELRLASGGAMDTGSLAANGGTLTLTSGGDLGAGALAGRDGIALTAAGNTVLRGGAASSAGDIALSVGGALTGRAISASGAIRMTGGGSIDIGDLTASGPVLASAAGDATFGVVRSSTGAVELRSTGGSLEAGNITAGTDLAVVASGDLAVENMAARDMLLLAGQGVATGRLTSSGGRILIAGNGMASAGGAFGATNFDAVFAASLQSAGGALAVTGPVSAGAFTAAIAGDANLLGIDAARAILVDSGGTVRLGGQLEAPQIELRANDLAMPAGSGLNAGVSGTIALVSRNAAGLRIGDGLDNSLVAATGFSLDNSEWSRINSGSLSVFGLDGAGAIDMLIGKLDVTGPDAGSTIDDPAGTVRFRTGVSPLAAQSGTVRVTGALKAIGMRATNALLFETGQFQLASDTGSVASLGTGDALSGAVRISAGDIHVAAAPVLAQLAADPFFAGVENALDNESAGGNGPVLRAGALDLTVGRTLYIQRSGAGADRLGFDDPIDGFRVRLAGISPITVIINGTFRTAAGLVGGIEAWQLFKDSGADLSGFTADSRLNGCLLNLATCGVVPPLEPRPDPDPGIPTLLDVLDPGNDNPSPDDPDEREERSASAILPRQPDALARQIDEPIAGSGNPALTGAGLGAAGGPLQ